MLKVAIATKSREKIEGVERAISEFFHTKEIGIYSQSVDSGVPEQPFEEQTYQGALQRINNLKQEVSDMDFYISCEAGIESAFGQYFNVQVVCIFDAKSQKLYWGKSAGWSIPSEDIEEIRKTNLDKYLRERGIGSIDELLGENNSRRDAVAQATELALASGRLKNT